MKNIISLGPIVYALCLYLAFFLYSPNIAVDAIKQAMQQKDVDLLEDFIDFNALQESIKRQVKAELILKASELGNNSGSASQFQMREVSFAVQIVEDFIDLFLTKEGVIRLFATDLNSSKDSSAFKTGKYLSILQSEKFIVDKEFEFQSLRSIQVKGYNAKGKEHKFIFVFRYFRWVLTDIIIDLHDVDNKKVVEFIREFKPI